MQRFKIKRIANISICVAMLCICAWISIPTAPPITLQTLAVFLIAMTLPLLDGIVALCVYIALGCFVPVFSGFQSIGALFASSGAGYVLGFFFIVFACALARRLSSRISVMFILALSGLFICYILGIIWYYYAFVNISNGLYSVIAICVLPFIVPDIIKLSIALLIYRRIKLITYNS